MKNLIQLEAGLILTATLFLTIFLSGCVSTEALTTSEHINLSPENMRFENNSNGRLDFGLSVSLNESDSLDNLETLPGLRIRSVRTNSVADLAGIQSGDILLEMNSIKTNSADTLAAIAEVETPKDYVDVLVKRDTTVFATKMTKPKILQRSKPEERYRVDAVKTRAGYRSEIISNPDQPETKQVVARIIEIFPDSPFFEKGIVKGDAIAAINGQSVTSAQALVNLMSQEYEFGETLEFSLLRESDPGNLTSRQVSLSLWEPKRKITGLRFWPLFNYESSIAPSGSKFSLIDFILFSVFSYERIEGETNYSILGILKFSSGYGELVEESETGGRP